MLKVTCNNCRHEMKRIEDGVYRCVECGVEGVLNRILPLEIESVYMQCDDE